MALLGQASLSEAIPMADAGDDVLEATVREHASLVYKVAYAVLRNHHDAEDATQETFIRVLRHRKHSAKVRQPRAWLARIAWRVALDRRKTRHEISFEEATQAVRQLRAAGTGAEQLAAERQMMVLLERLIASLPRKLRHVLTLATVEEMSSVEIAEVLGIPEASVRTRLLRARQLLRQKLSGLLEGKYAR